MRLVGLSVLEKFSRRHVDTRLWLEDWVLTLIEAEWRRLGDARQVYPNADGVKLKSSFVVTVFNCKGNEYRLLTRIVYAGQCVEALEVMAHAEFSKNSWKTKY